MKPLHLIRIACALIMLLGVLGAWPGVLGGLGAWRLWIVLVLTAVSIALLACAYYLVAMPLQAVIGGLDLIRAQDFASRLRSVGHPEADSLVTLFNSMMDRLKEERLRITAQNQLLTLLVNASPLAVIIFDYDGFISEANPAALRLLEAKNLRDIAGSTIADIPGDAARAMNGVEPGSTAVVRLSDNVILRVQRLWFHHQGFRRPFITAEALTDDIQRAEREAYGKVIRIIAHEVNNTMGGVTSLLQTLASLSEADPGSDPDITAAIRGCSNRCQSLGRFITSYADVVKIPEPRLLPVDLVAFLNRLHPFVEEMGRRSGVTVTLRVPKESITVQADAMLLEQALVNIVKNAIESVVAASPALPAVEIALSVSPATITVTDNGTGISPEASRHLFSPFFSTKRGGQGLGLMFVSEILRRHHYRFRLLTDPGTSLTRFTITLTA